MRPGLQPRLMTGPPHGRVRPLAMVTVPARYITCNVSAGWRNAGHPRFTDACGPVPRGPVCVAVRSHPPTPLALRRTPAVQEYRRQRGSWQGLVRRWVAVGTQCDPRVPQCVALAEHHSGVAQYTTRSSSEWTGTEGCQHRHTRVCGGMMLSQGDACCCWVRRAARSLCERHCTLTLL